MPRRQFSSLRQLGILIAIPALMVVAPLVGLFLGQYADRKLKIGPWGTLAGLVLGFGAAIREIRVLIRKAQQPVEKDPDEP